jgi:hypothetical protein
MYLRTPLVDAQIAARARARGINAQEVIERIMLEPMPKEQFIKAEEMPAALEFLAGHAARKIAGQTIVMDGGWAARPGRSRRPGSRGKPRGQHLAVRLPFTRDRRETRWPENLFGR